MRFVCNAVDHSAIGNALLTLCTRLAKISSGHDEARFVVPDDEKGQPTFLIDDSVHEEVGEVPALRVRFLISFSEPMRC